MRKGDTTFLQPVDSMTTALVANPPRLLGPRQKVRFPARHRAQPETPWRCDPTSSSNRRPRLIRPTVGRSGISSLCQRLDRLPLDLPVRPPPAEELPAQKD